MKRWAMAAQDPKNAQAKFDLAVAHADLAEVLTPTGAPVDALEHAKQSLQLLEQLSRADPTNAVYRRNVALCYEKFGDAYSALAKDEKRLVSQRLLDWNDGRTWYQKAASVFRELREHHALMPSDSGEPERFASKADECLKAIAQIKAPR